MTGSIQKTLEARYTKSFWVKAEMNKLNFYRHSGHCYPDLLEKKEGRVVAQMRATLWSGDYQRINQQFLEVLKEPLKDGINILFEARVSFTSSHGLSLHILDMEPTFTLGALELEKQQTIQKLTAEGIFHQNKQLKLALLPQRIAIISVETSKGYADFLKVLEGNSWGYQFFHMLFPALLQGDQAVGSIITQLRRIEKVKQHFDVVAIIRGGGGEVGLACYNHYELARFMALYPLPVLTGIGHATNETVAEMVSHSNAITPTKLAEMLLQCFHNFSVPVKEARQKVTQYANLLLQSSKDELLNEVRFFNAACSQSLTGRQYSLEMLSRKLAQSTTEELSGESQNLRRYRQQLSGALSLIRQEQVQLQHHKLQLKTNSGFHFNQAKTNLEHLEKTVSLLDSMQVVKRGYSMTVKEGKVVQSIREIQKGDRITTILADGNIQSTVD